MALTFPLSAATFADLLRVSDIVFKLQWSQQKSVVGNGSPIYADRAAPMWTVEITTVPMPRSEALGLMALINSLGGGMRTFLLYNPEQPLPVSDPDGLFFAPADWLLYDGTWDDDGVWYDGILWSDDAIVAQVGAISSRWEPAFTAFPPYYTVTPGDFFEITFDTSRKYLGQFVEGGQADLSGNLGPLTVAPPLPASIVTGDDVNMIKPCGKFRIVPNSAFPTHVNLAAMQIAFQAEQTYDTDPA